MLAHLLIQIYQYSQVNILFTLLHVSIQSLKHMMHIHLSLDSQWGRPRFKQLTEERKKIEKKKLQKGRLFEELLVTPEKLSSHA